MVSIKSVVKNWKPGEVPTKDLSNKSTFTSNQSQYEGNNVNTGAACKIKGNINSKGKKLYHLPGMNNYEAVKAEKMFCSEEEAQKAGFTKAS